MKKKSHLVINFHTETPKLKIIWKHFFKYNINAPVVKDEEDIMMNIKELP